MQQQALALQLRAAPEIVGVRLGDRPVIALEILCEGRAVSGATIEAVLPDGLEWEGSQTEWDAVTRQLRLPLALLKPEQTRALSLPLRVDIPPGEQPYTLKLALRAMDQQHAEATLVFYKKTNTSEDMALDMPIDVSDLPIDTPDLPVDAPDMPAAQDMAPGCPGPMPWTCNADGSPPRQVLARLPARPRAVNGQLTCSTAPPTRVGCYKDGDHMMNWCSSAASVNNSKLYARVFDSEVGPIFWLERVEPSGYTSFSAAPNFVGLSVGQLPSIWDLSSFAAQDPREGWRPPTPQTFQYRDGGFVFRETVNNQRDIAVRINQHGIAELYSGQDFIVSPYLSNLEGEGAPPVWQCFAECVEDSFCQLAHNTQNVRCDRTLGLCVEP